ncbi:transforming growth factor-beta-induced protein ig-h3-like [Artemia franciscana]|uniref:FAS1 domain-containing protein n=1 Tax=Artemia franciscana TaxID=6661 RepID=A0AA88L4V4_ARTSF|nr:hypothetical protein QYM36_011468 [Artemia franciscana]
MTYFVAFLGFSLAVALAAPDGGHHHANQYYGQQYGGAPQAQRVHPQRPQHHGQQYGAVHQTQAVHPQSSQHHGQQYGAALQPQRVHPQISQVHGQQYGGAQPAYHQQIRQPVQPTYSAPKNIPGVASDLGASTLVDLVVKAGLADALSGPGPFTVFAPTNEAFAALPKPTLDALGRDTALLQKVLLYHVVQGEVPSTALANELTAPTLQGAKVRVNIYGHAITVNGAQVIKPDVRASNGIIHVVNRVLYPIPETPIPSVLINDPHQRFTTLVTAVQQAGLVDTLSADGPYTLFAPTNDAFAALPPGALDGLLKDRAALSSVLLGHVVPGTVFAVGVPTAGAVQTAQPGKQIHLQKSSGGVTVNGANVIQADIPATNGVIHVINRVI